MLKQNKIKGCQNCEFCSFFDYRNENNRNTEYTIECNAVTYIDRYSVNMKLQSAKKTKAMLS